VQPKKKKKRNTKRTNNPIRKWTNELNRVLKRITNGQWTHEKKFNILSHEGNARQLRFYLTSVRTAIMEKGNNKCWWGCWWEYKLVQPLRKSRVEALQKTKNMILLYYSWAYEQRNVSLHTKEIPVYPRLIQHYSE
jgi:predicted RNase H-like HicB family nuclease